MSASNTSVAINRIADALFTQAKAMSKQVKVAERQCELAEVMLQVQMQNLATSKALEQKLTGANLKNLQGDG